MGWLDDLRRDPDATHRRLLASLYRPAGVAACFAAPTCRRKGIVFVDVSAPAPLVLLPPDAATGAREVVFRLPDGMRVARDPRSGVRRRHMLAFALPMYHSANEGQR